MYTHEFTGAFGLRGGTMAKIIDGKRIASEIRQTLRQEIANLSEKIGRRPCLAVIWVGEHPASATYIRAKTRACEEIDMNFKLHHLPKNTNSSEALSLIEDLNQNRGTDGILVQLPLPEHLLQKRITEAISPKKDVDGFHPYNLGQLMIGEPVFTPCTPAGIFELLKQEKIPTDGAEVVILGRSNIVGKPLANLLLQKNIANATVTICHTGTKDLCFHTGRADILIVAIGRPKMIGKDMIKDGAIIIDVGIHRLPEGLCGDVDFLEVKEKAAAITPVPGGVGPMTVAMLLKNTVKAYKQHFLDKC
jgi:methylenetetrahydrofolate dehydrogenase (NADP+)/methenyltetrahydrofolate cyclohydrolase